MRYQLNSEAPMHEATIVQGILNIALNECLKNGFKRINSITIEVGKLHAINMDSLLFAFDVMKGDTKAGDAELKIIERDITIFCRSCNSHFSVQEFPVLRCPSCGMKDFEITGGSELNILELEVS